MRRLLTHPSLEWMLVFVPASIVADIVGQPILVFITSGLAIIPLAGLIGRSTDQLAARVGPRLGGLLNATFGNITELIVAVLLIRADNFLIVKASLIGSILGNLLLVLGVAFVVGGFRHKEQEFSARAAGVHSSSLLLAVAGLLLPALLVLTTPNVGFVEKEVVSGVVAIVLIVLYLAALVFTEITHAHLFERDDREHTATWSTRRSVVVLVLAALFVGLESELLVGSLTPAISALRLSPIFVGLIVIPIIGNAAEHSSAVFFAIKDRVDITLEIAVGSSTQVAMFVAPILVFISLALGHPMDFIFSAFEVAVVSLATVIVALIALEGRSNWLSGFQLVGAYILIATAGFFIKSAA
ncbi:MAG: calcium/proton exchanger [Candidatus Dormibacteraeota bacterium]|nr:calcium/proton exchanger [Candidatus Dormibacteraeota bacterium]